MASNLSSTIPLSNPGGINQNLIQKFNGFNIEPVQYPIDLGAEDLKHWVQFTINVRGKSLDQNSLLGNERILGEVKRDPDSANLNADQLSTASENIASVAGAATGAAIGKIGVDVFGKLTNRGTKTGGVSKTLTGLTTVAAGAAGFLAARDFVKTNELLKPDTTFKISDAIALYIDGPPTVRYAAQYSNKDLGTMAGLLSQSASAVNMGESIAAIAMQFAKVPQALGVNIPDVVGASAKVALNPFKEVIFEAIDFRTFNFKYRFFPKSVQEANNVEKIIKLFKFHMHPDISSNKLFFIYPSEFEIAYYFENNENTYFHKLKPSVLESMDVTYGGEQFSSFFDGKPTEVNVTLTFRETEILTKKQIRDGF